MKASKERKNSGANDAQAGKPHYKTNRAARSDSCRLLAAKSANFFANFAMKILTA